jgi:PKD repeat protein
VKINSQLASQATTVKKNSTIAISIPSVPQGTLVTQVLTGPDGKKYVLVSGTTSVAGKVNSPTLKFAKAGTYTVTLTVGKVKKTVKITVK